MIIGFTIGFVIFHSILDASRFRVRAWLRPWTCRTIKSWECPIIPEERGEFRKGYTSIAPLDFLTEEYPQFPHLHFLLFNLAYKVRNKRKINHKGIDILSMIVT